MLQYSTIHHVQKLLFVRLAQANNIVCRVSYVCVWYDSLPPQIQAPTAMVG